MTEFAVDSMRDVNTKPFRNEVYEGYHMWMVQDDIKHEDGIAEEWNLQFQMGWGKLCWVFQKSKREKGQPMKQVCFAGKLFV